MAWLTKGNRRYYYASKRMGERVVSQYVGTGYTAQLAEQLNERVRLAAKVKQTEWAAIKAEQAHLEAMVSDFDKVAAAYMDALMLLTGHHQHKRMWRKQRERTRKKTG